MSPPSDSRPTSALRTSRPHKSPATRSDGPGPVWLCLLAIWAVVTAYNLFKPFHIDDAAHLIIAQNIIRDPLHPMSGMLNWDGIDEPVWHTNQPHLYFYLIAAFGSVFGFSEPAMHVFQSFFALAAIVLFYRLARFLAPQTAVWATAMLAIGPAFVVEQNLMTDVVLLASWLLFFSPLIMGVHSEKQTSRYTLAAIACAIALLIKYSSLILLPILAASIFLERHRRQSWTILIPLVTLVAWSTFNWADYGGIHIFRAVTQFLDSPARSDPLQMIVPVARRSGAWVIALGALLPLGIVAVAEHWRSRKAARAVYAAATLAVIAIALGVATSTIGDTIADRLLACAFAINALLTVAAVLPHARGLIGTVPGRIGQARSDAPRTLLLAWIVAASLFYILFSPFVAARHVLTILPPIILLFVMRPASTLPRGARNWSFAVTALVSFGLCRSDWHFAAFFRDGAAHIARHKPPSATLWTAGHWGWQWYAEQHGIGQLDTSLQQLRPGDWLIVTEGQSRYPVTMTPELKLVGRISQDPSKGLFCTSRPASFYSSSISLPPWTLSGKCQAYLDIYVYGRSGREERQTR